MGFATEEDDKLKKVPVTGGPPITLAVDVQGGVAGGSWGDDGYIVYSSSGFKTSRVRGTGGAPEVLSSRDSTKHTLLWPFVLPGGKAVLFERCSANCSVTDLVWFDVATRAETVLVPGATRGWYLPSGHLIYATREGAIYAVSFDARTGEVQGSAAPVLDQVRGGTDNGFRLAVSASGAMIYLQGAQLAGNRVVEVDRAGRETTVRADYADYGTLRWSPTRDRIVLSKTVGEERQIMIYDVRSQTLAQLTTEGSNQRPSWSPDGTRVAFYSARAGVQDLYWMSVDRSTPAERVADGDDTRNGSTTFWTRDGAWVVFDGSSSDATKIDEDIFAVSTGTDRKRKTVIATAASDQNGEVSPDGKWIAYSSDEGGEYKVYVSPFMREGGRWLVSTAAAAQSRWASNSELVYLDLSSRTMMAAKLDLGPIVRVTERTSLFSGMPYAWNSVVGASDYDISRDGQRFLMLRMAPITGEHSAPIVVLQWAEEIKRRMVEQGGRTP